MEGCLLEIIRGIIITVITIVIVVILGLLAFSL